MSLRLADKEVEAAKERARTQHKQLTKQRQHQARLPAGAGGRRAALVGNKGQRLLANAQRLQADKVRAGLGSGLGLGLDARGTQSGPGCIACPAGLLRTARTAPSPHAPRFAATLLPAASRPSQPSLRAALSKLPAEPPGPRLLSGIPAGHA